MNGNYVRRKDTGRPGGAGKFDIRNHPEASIALSPRRRADIADGRGLDAVSSPVIEGVDESSREAWWLSELSSAEWRQEGGVPKMPDDVTPSNGSGRSITGHRRTYRKRYGNETTWLRMPSVSAIRSFADTAGPNTFDVPITMSYDGGQVQGWVRVTTDGEGRWTGRGLGMTPRDDAYATEAVSALLEARTPSHALTDIASLMERRRQRFAQEGVKGKSLRSTFIRSAHFDRQAGALAVRIGDRAYSYRATEAMYRQLLAAKVPGAVYNRLIKGAAQGHPVSVCDRCGNFYSPTVDHRCAMTVRSDINTYETDAWAQTARKAVAAATVGRY